MLEINCLRPNSGPLSLTLIILNKDHVVMSATQVNIK